MVPVAARPWALAGLARSVRGPLLVVVPSEIDAERLSDDVALFVDQVFFLPAWETLPFEHLSPNVTTMAKRSEARHVLKTGSKGTVVIAPVRAAIQRLSPSPVGPLTVALGDTVSIDELVHWLSDAGYERSRRVEARGEFAVRGGIVDVFPAQGSDPVRVDLFGDLIEDLRVFSPGDQRSAEAVEQMVAYPAREFRPDPTVMDSAGALMDSEPWNNSVWERLREGMVFEGMESWLPWLAPERCLLDELDTDVPIAVFDPVRTVERGIELQREEADLAEALASTWGRDVSSLGDHPALFLDVKTRLGRIPTIDMPPVPASPSDVVLEIGTFAGTAGDPESVAAAVQALIDRGDIVVIAMDGEAAADRTARILAENGTHVPRGEFGGGSVIVSQGLHRGFLIPSQKVAVLGEEEIAGRRQAHRRSGRKPVSTGAEYRDLQPGDFVVHYRHGIGRFESLVSRSMAGVERDYLVIAYAGKDRLYVPVDQLAAVKKYTGGEQPRISRMGGRDWAETKGRIRRQVAAVAEEVVRLHRKRARATGHPFPEDTPWQSEMESLFVYEETPDQLSAIAAVKTDMEAEKPMDRLVFGDVGFGKTEVALRAAFKAAVSGKQVAVLCPTTLLAQQHLQTFSERMAPYPIRVAMLSRFLTSKETRQVLKGIAAGDVDIVIGTHRLLSDDVLWKDLGLLVVDEEQRFGVSAKDQIKRLKVGMDVVTLTATPIPRTLEMALTGIREVSHIKTPPEDRHPILTFVGPHDERTISAAIRRELLREGQVFYVHNRVRSIEKVAEELRELVPEARYAVAHGQMSEGRLEQVMLDFWAREYDVLVATTIIESGLDLPQVNTLIVDRADLLGLGQLYQLRGRVGRSSQRAYAYLFHPHELSLSEDAHRRLEAIGEATDLGSGFQLALKDLEIRGAGSILGEVQSGHIAAVGFDLYTELVAEAVDKLEGREPIEEDPADVRIDLPVDAHLPEEYVDDLELRLEVYRHLALAKDPAEVDRVEEEWIDRFGAIPPPAEALIEMARLRVEAIRVGLKEIVKLRHEIRLSPVDLSASQEVRLQRLQPRAVLRAQEGILFIPAPPGLVAGILGFLREMWPLDITSSSAT